MVFSAQEFLWIQIDENRKKKLPDQLADSYKRMSVNQITAGLKIFLLPSIFEHTLVS